MYSTYLQNFLDDIFQCHDAYDLIVGVTMAGGGGGRLDHSRLILLVCLLGWAVSEIYGLLATRAAP
jgi:hypothetical protein